MVEDKPEKRKFDQTKIREQCCGGLVGWAETGNAWAES